jgi:L,D-peptidoglycan transpeptidase YkuD (ErfK/YbiS/YcfS/YnhG family)
MPVTTATTSVRKPQATGPNCPSTLASTLHSTSGAAQIITVVAAGYTTTHATLTAWALSDACWHTALGPFPARLGAAGLHDHRVEGDGSTPTGVFGVGPVMYGNGPNPGTRYPYHALQCGDWWDGDPASPQYNMFVHVTCGSRPPFAAGSEALWTVPDAYRSFAVIDYNTHPVVPGLGSGIFLADGTAMPTVGCVSLGPTDHDAVLGWLDPAARPLVVIGTAAEFNSF